MKIIQWLKNQYNKIVCSNDTQYTNKISELNKLIEIYKSHESELNRNISNKEALISIYINELDNVKQELKSLQDENKVYPLPELDVDWDMHPYFPSSRIYFYNSIDKQVNEYSVQWTPSKLTRVWTDEMYNYVISNSKKIKDKTEKEKVIFFRDLVLTKCKYQYDLNQQGLSIENWKLPTDTFYSGFGDCEDLTNLWLTFCNIYGIPSNKVFNLTGFYNTTGHSFGGYLDDDNKMWVIECTSKFNPVLMKGSVYRCKGSLNGLSNWNCSGIPKVEQF